MAVRLFSKIRFVPFLLMGLGCVTTAMITVSLIIKKGAEVVWINSMHNPFWDGFFYLITSLGNGLLIVPFLLMGLFYRFRFVLSTGISFLILGSTCLLLKSLMAHPRPIALLHDSPLHFVPGVIVHVHHSFPSGHTATAFCFAVLTATSMQSKKAFLLLLFLASLVGLSRIYLLQHFLIDVGAGALLGAGIGFTVWHFVQQMEQPWLDSSVDLGSGRKVSHAEENNPVPSFSE